MDRARLQLFLLERRLFQLAHGKICPEVDLSLLSYLNSPRNARAKMD